MRLYLPLGYEHRAFPNDFFPGEVFVSMLRPVSLPTAVLGDQGIRHLSKQRPVRGLPHTRVTRAELTTQAESSDAGVRAASDLGHAEAPVRWGLSPERQQIAGYQERERRTLALSARLKQCFYVQNQKKAAGRGCRIIHILHAELSCTSQVYRCQDLQLFRVHPIGHTRRIAS